MTEDSIKQAILAMPECDKNGLILSIVNAIYHDPDTGELDATLETNADTMDRVVNAIEAQIPIQS